MFTHASFHLLADGRLPEQVWSKVSFQRERGLAPHPVVGLVLQVGNAEMFRQALGIESLEPFSRASKQDPCFTSVEEDGGDKRLVQLELACEVDGFAPPDPV